MKIFDVPNIQPRYTEVDASLSQAEKTPWRGPEVFLTVLQYLQRLLLLPCHSFTGMILNFRSNLSKPARKNANVIHSIVLQARWTRRPFRTCVPGKSYPQPPQQPNDGPDFRSYIDKPPQYVSVGRNKNIPGLLILRSRSTIP